MDQQSITGVNQPPAESAMPANRPAQPIRVDADQLARVLRPLTLQLEAATQQLSRIAGALETSNRQARARR